MSKPNVAEDLRRIHMIITRGLDVATESAARFAQEGFSDPALSEGYRSYVAALLSFLHAHHLAEDDIAFPYFGELLPEMPVARLQEEHQRMERLLEQAGEALEGLDEEPEQRLPQLEATLSHVQELWQPHIALEEAHFGVEHLAELLPPEEHGRLAGLMAQHSMENSGPDYLVVPFALYNLPADQRAILSGAMPPMVTQQLVPGPWKEKWAPMQPFLLD
jgi:hemerythrin-like domain-containing protein